MRKAARVDRHIRLSGDLSPQLLRTGVDVRRSAEHSLGGVCASVIAEAGECAAEDLGEMTRGRPLLPNRQSRRLGLRHLILELGRTRHSLAIEQRLVI